MTLSLGLCLSPLHLADCRAALLLAIQTSTRESESHLSEAPDLTVLSIHPDTPG